MTASPQPLDLSAWLNDEEAAARLGCSARSLSRAVEVGTLHPQYRQRPGTRPQRVFDPEEIRARQRPGPMQVMPAAQPIQTGVQTVLPGAAGMSETALVRPEETGAVIARLVEMYVGATRQPKPWATLEEAADELGLSVAFLRRRIEAGELEAVKDRNIKVRRGDLEVLDVTSALLGPRKRRGGKRGAQ